MRVLRRGTLAPPARRHHVWISQHNPGAREVLDELKWAGGYEGKLLVTDEPAQLAEADHVLLYLSLATWRRDDDDDGARKSALAEEVGEALQQGRKLLLVHEMDEERGGVFQFGHFFGADQTPPELLQLKIYAEVAVPMKEGDVLLVDNYRVLHGRDIFKGDRYHAVSWFTWPEEAGLAQSSDANTSVGDSMNKMLNKYVDSLAPK